MKASETEFLQFLQNARQLAVPVYQRPYSWNKNQWEQLWDDIVSAGDPGATDHFVGCVVHMEHPGVMVAKPPADVIDGQQRLTTLTLLLCAVARRLSGDSALEARLGITEAALYDWYLRHNHAVGGPQPKLLLGNGDKDVLRRIVFSESLAGTDPKSAVTKCFDYFVKKTKRLGDDELMDMWSGLSKLAIVDVALEADKDDPQRIFEGLNSTGLGLYLSDLVRNAVLMNLDYSVQRKLYHECWHPMETRLHGRKDFDRFIEVYLTMRRHKKPPRRAYESFKGLLEDDVKDGGSPERLSCDMKKHSEHYRAMVHGEDVGDTDTQPCLRTALADLRAVNNKSVDWVYSLMLELFNDWCDNRLDDEDFVEIIRLLESYMVRRLICGYRAQQNDHTFAGLLGKDSDENAFDKSRYVDEVHNRLKALSDKTVFPSDEDFREALTQVDLYTKHKAICRHVLARIEQSDGDKERLKIDELQVEHVMPQTLSDEWREQLGDDTDRHKQWVHRLGNLTLTGYNPEMSNKPFPEKRNMPGGYKASRLRMNQAIAEHDSWGPEEIEARGRVLADAAVKAFPAP